jgi:hypothetical protein
VDIEPVGLKKPDPAALACGARANARKHSNATRKSTRRWRKAREIAVMSRSIRYRLVRLYEHG